MAVITEETKAAWQALGEQLARQRPYAGRTVRIVRGKDKGKNGVVTWHGVDSSYSTRYEDGAQVLLRQMEGRRGYRIRVQPDTGTAFFCKADYAEVQA